MESLLVGTFSKPIRPSSSSLAPGVSRVWSRWNTIRFQHSTVRIHKLSRLASPVASNHDQSSEQNIHPYNRRQKKFLVKAASENSHKEHDFEVIHRKVNGKSVIGVLHAFYRFLKPYTLIPTLWSVVSISLLAVEKLSDFNPLFFQGVLQLIIGATLANSYVACINQLSDIEIDKVNKSYLPLLSGEISMEAGVVLASLYTILSFLLGWSVNSWPLRLGFILWFAFGTAYSVNLPFLRWKRNPVLAATCVWSFQGLIIPILLHLHIQTYVFGRAAVLSKHVIFVAGFMTIYSIVLSLFKDIPDIDGDKANGIQSLAAQIGQKPVFWICIWLLEVAYGVAALIGLTSKNLWIRVLHVLYHGILGFILWRKANSTKLESNEAFESFYRFIWKLYCADYLWVPILRL